MSPSNRRLAAILSADVRGFTPLMADDEAATQKTIVTHRPIISHVVTQYGGRVVDSKGDEIMAEFSSAVDALGSAIEIQRKLNLKNSSLPDQRRMDWGIGINLGDIITENGHIYGTGVIVAARIQKMAEAGWICISRSIFEETKGKLNFQFIDLGEHSLEGINEPVRVYRVVIDGGGGRSSNPNPKRKYTIEVKLIIVLQTMLEDKSVAQIAKEYQVSPSSVYRWRKEFVNGGMEEWDKTEKVQLLKYITKKPGASKKRIGTKVARFLKSILEL